MSEEEKFKILLENIDFTHTKKQILSKILLN